MNKQNIAIFGDSFANFNLDLPTGLSWVDIIQQEFNVTNKAKVGSSIYHCYEMILNIHQDYDYSIFIVPESSRYSAPIIEETFPNYIMQNTFWYNTLDGALLTKQVLENYKKNLPSIQYIMLEEIVNSAIYRYKYWDNYRYYKTMGELMVNDLLKRFSNIVIIHTQDINDNPGLASLCFWELNKLKKKKKHIGFNKKLNILATDIRKNHLSEENNIILGHKILNAIKTKQTEVKINIDDFVVPNIPYEKCIQWQPM